MIEFIVEHFHTIYDEITLKYPELDDSIAKSIAVVGMLRTYQDVDNVKDMIKDGAFVKTYYNNASIEFSKSRSRGLSNSLLYNGKIKRECVNDKFEMVHTNKIIEGLVNDY